MGKCCIPGCRNSRERIPGLTFHQIPSNEPWRASWMEVLTKNGVKAFTEWTLVCGEHFTHEDYKMTARKNFLLPSAVPSVFTIKPCRNAPKKRGRKPKALLQQQQQQLAATRLGEPQRVTVLRSVVAEGNDVADDDDEDYDPASDGVRRTGRPRKRKVFTDMVVYMPKATSDGQRAENEEMQTITLTFPREDGDDSEEHVDATSSSATLTTSEVVRSEDLPQAATPDAEALQGSDDVAKQQPPKNLNVIVFTNQPRPASTLTRSRTDDHNSAGVVDDPSSDYPGNPRRRCCQIQTQRLLFYKSVITKLRKRVLALEASLAEKEKELASIEAQRDLDMVL
uniref:THAP domain containing protein n=1 Tax=Rhipicephalus appendiculatus TaxID=34631 RepID=A0A131YL49_RHIAP